MNETKFHPELPSDVVDTHINDFLSKPVDQQDVSDLKDLSSHPNLSSAGAEKLYNHISNLPSLSRNHYHAIENISGHPNTPAHVLNNLAEKISQSENYNDYPLDILQNPSVDKTHKKNIAIKAIENNDEYLLPVKGDPSHYFDILDHAKTVEDKARKHRYFKYALKGLSQTDKHNHETLSTAVNHLTAPDEHIKDHISENPSSYIYYLSNLVSKQKNLSADHLDKVHSIASSLETGGDYQDKWDVIEHIADHKNTSPALLASMATIDLDSRDFNSFFGASRVKENAIANSSLPQETFERLVSEPGEYLESILRNPKIEERHIRDLYEKYKNNKSILKHEKTPEDLIEKYWNESDKSTEAARDILDMANAPTSVLKEIVNHKNQNVAIDALNHGKVDEDVLNTALNRKAVKIQEVARKHPLVADREISNGLLSGKIKPTLALHDKTVNEHFNKMPKEDQKKVISAASKLLAGSDVKEIAASTKYEPEKVIAIKASLLDHPLLSEEEKNAHGADIIDMAEKLHGANVVIDEYRGSSSSPVLNALKEAINSENKGATEKALDSNTVLLYPKMYEEAPPRFIEKAYEKVKNLLESPEANLTTSYGLPLTEDNKKRHLNDISAQVIKNPNTPDKLFFDLLKDKKFVDKISSDSIRSSGWRAEGYLDFRYKNASDSKKNEDYNKILEEHPHAKELVLTASTAPQQAWSKAWSMMTDEEKGNLSEHLDFVRRPQFRAHREAVLLGKEAFSGEYNQRKFAQNNITDLQANILKSLDSSKKEDFDLVKKFMQSEFAKDQSDSTKIHGYPILKHINKDFLRNHSGADDLLKIASQYGPLLASDWAMEMIASNPNAEDAINYLKQASQYNAQIHEGEEARQESVSEFWKNTLNRLTINQGFWNRAKRDLPEGSLDFLADISPAVKSAALSAGVLSDAKSAEIIDQNPALLGQKLDSMNQQEMHSYIHKAARQDLKQYQIDAIIKRISGASLSGRVSKNASKFNDEHKETLKLLVDQLAQKDPSKISLLALKLTHEVGHGRISYTDHKKVVNSIYKMVQENPALSSSQKNSIYAEMYSQIPKLTPAALNKTLAKAAEKEADFNTLVKLIRAMPSKSISDSINNLLKKSQSLTPDQLDNAIDMISYGSFNPSHEAIRGFVSEYEKRNSEYPEKMSDMLLMVGNQMHYSEEDQEKFDFLSNTISKHRLSDNADIQKAANTVAAKTISLMPKDDAAKVFASLPSEADNFKGDDPATYISLDKNTLNDPKVIESATSGWKLNAIMRHAYELNSDSMKAIVNRVLAHSDISSIDPYFMDKFTKEALLSDSIKDEDSVKLIRMQPDGHKKLSSSLLTESINSRDTSSAFNAIATNAYNALDVAMNSAQDVFDNPNKIDAAHMDDKHRKEILSNLVSASNMIGASFYSSDISNFNIKYSQAIDAIEKINQYLGAIKEKLATVTDASSFEGDMLKLRQISQALTATGLKFDASSAENISSILQHHKDIANLYSNAGGSKYYQSMSYYTNSLIKILPQFHGLKKDNWAKIFEAHPAAIYGLSNRSSVGQEEFSAFNLNDIINDKDVEPSDQVRFWEALFPKMEESVIKEHGKVILPKVVDYLKKNEEGNRIPGFLEATVKYIVPMMSSEEVENIFDKLDPSEQMVAYLEAMKSGYKNDDKIDSLVDGFLGKIDSNDVSHIEVKKFEEIIANANLPPKSIVNLLSHPKFSKTDLTESLSKNSTLDDKAFAALIENTPDPTSKFMSNALQHRSISKNHFDDYFNKVEKTLKFKSFSDSAKFNPGYLNPVFGGDKIRELPVDISAENVDNAKLPRSALGGLSADALKKKERLTQFMGRVPAEGMTWADFKKANPDAEKFAEIKKIFMNKKNQMALPEDFVSAIKKVESESKTGEFALTYSTWDRDLQTHANKKSLVIQLNPSKHMEQELNSDPQLWALTKKLMELSNSVSTSGEYGQISLHPTTPQCIGWVRIDTSANKDGWIIEEFQSDFAQKFRRNLNKIIENNVSGMQLDGKFVPTSKLREYAKKIDKSIEGYMNAQLDAAKKAAKAHGVKTLYMHGHGIRANMSGGGRWYVKGRLDHKTYDKDFVHPRILDTYEKFPEKSGFKKVDYSDYPTKSASTLKSTVQKGLPTYCWAMDLEDEKP